MIANFYFAAFPSVEDYGPAESDAVAAPVGKQCHMIANDNATACTRLDAYGTSRTKDCSQLATLHLATHTGAQRGQHHVCVDAQHIVGGVDLVEECAGHVVGIFNFGSWLQPRRLRCGGCATWIAAECEPGRTAAGRALPW